MNTPTNTEIREEILLVQGEKPDLVLTQREADRVVALVQEADMPNLPLVEKVMADVIDGYLE